MKKYIVLSFLFLIPFLSFSQDKKINSILKETQLFEENKQQAFVCYLQNDYKNCIRHYKACKKTRYYNANLDYIAGVSYFHTGRLILSRKSFKLARTRGYNGEEYSFAEFLITP